MVASSDTSTDSVGGQTVVIENTKYFAVDNKSKHIVVVERNGSVLSQRDVKSLDEIAESTSQMEFSDWVKAVLTKKPSFSIPIFLPLFGLALFGGYMYWLQLDNFAIAPFIPLIPGFLTYQIVKRQLTTTAIVIRRTDSGENYMMEDEFWNWDYFNFPEECKRFNGKQWIAWIDCRDERNNVIRPFIPPPQDESKVGQDEINASDIMGMESYLKAAYNIGNMRPQESFIEANLPYLAIIIGGFAAVFFAASRIQEMLGIAP